MQQTITTTQSQVTISSLEIVDLINESRKPDAPKLRHDDFLRKVSKVLGDGVARNFTGNYIAANGKQNPCYHFPKREACLMAMSYSYELQAKVYDRMTELEQSHSLPSPALLSTILDHVKRLETRLDGAERKRAAAESAAQQALDMVKPLAEIGQGDKFTLVRSYYRSGKKQLAWALKFHSLQLQATQLQLDLLTNEEAQVELEATKFGRPVQFPPESLLSMFEGEVRTGELMSIAKRNGWKTQTFLRAIKKLKSAGQLVETKPGKWRAA